MNRFTKEAASTKAEAASFGGPGGILNPNLRPRAVQVLQKDYANSRELQAILGVRIVQ